MPSMAQQHKVKAAEACFRQNALQVEHCSGALEELAAALSAAAERHEEPIAQACSALEAVLTAHAQLQVSSLPVPSTQGLFVI